MTGRLHAPRVFSILSARWKNFQVPGKRWHITDSNKASKLLAYLSAFPIFLLLLNPQAELPQSHDYARLGQFYLNHNEPGKAISEFEEALKLNPEDPQALFNLALALKLWGDPRGAEKLLRKTLLLKPNFPEAHFALGLVLGDHAGSEQRALPEFQIAVAQNPSYAEAYYDIGMIHWKANELPQALESFRKAAELRPDSAPFRVRYGEALARAGELKEAEHELEEAVRLDPTHRIGFYELARIQESLGEKEKATETIGVVHQLEGGATEMLERSQLDYNEGVGALQRGSTEQAILKLTDALKGTRKESLVRTALGIALERKGDFAAARTQLEKVIQADPSSIDGHLNLGVVFMQMGDVPGAEREFRTVVTIDPGFADAYYNLGLMKAAQKDWPHAAKWIEQSLRLNPNNARAYFAMGRVLRDSGDLDSSLHYFQSTCKLDSTLVQAKLEYGKVLVAKNLIREAIAVWTDGLKVDPTNQELYENLVAALEKEGMSREAQAERRKFMFLSKGDRPGEPSEYEQGNDYLNHGEYEKAVTCFEDVLKKEPAYDEVRHRLAFALFGQGSNEAAAQEFGELVKLEPRDANLRLSLGIALLRAGRVSEAKTELLRVLDLDPNSASGHFQMGLVYLSEHDEDRAMAEFHQARRIDPELRPPGTQKVGTDEN